MKIGTDTERKVGRYPHLCRVCGKPSALTPALQEQRFGARKVCAQFDHEPADEFVSFVEPAWRLVEFGMPPEGLLVETRRQERGVLIERVELWCRGLQWFTDGGQLYSAAPPTHWRMTGEV